MKKKIGLLIIVFTFLLCAFTACSPFDNGDGGDNSQPTQLAAPVNLQLNGTVLTWDAVPNANSYNIKATSEPDGYYFCAAQTNSHDLSITTEGVWKIEVQAIGDNVSFSESEWSDAIEGYSTKKYQLTLTKNIVVAGNISSSEYRTLAGTEVTVTASTQPDYSWLGWFDGETKVSDNLSYTFEMPAKSLTLEARWGDFQLARMTNNVSYGTVSGNYGRIAAGTEVTVSASTKPNYSWLGWFDGETKVSDNLSYTFEMPAKSLTLEARWGDFQLARMANNVSYGIVTGDYGRIAAGTEVTVSATIRSSSTPYTWLGWFDGNELVSEDLIFTFTMPYRSVTLTATWGEYNVILECTEGGTVSGAGGYVAGREKSVTATTDNGYTFLGWFEGENETAVSTALRYTFIMPFENITLTAKWMACPVTLTTNLSGAKVSGVEKTIIGVETTITANTYSGFTWLGWYDGETKVSTGNSLTYTFIMTETPITYQARWGDYSINLVSTVSGEISTAAGSVSGTGRFVADTERTITATTKANYTWLGWHDSDGELVTIETSYTFIMPFSNIFFEARYGDYRRTIIKTLDGEESEAGGRVSDSGRIEGGYNMTLTVYAVNAGYSFVGWFDDDGILMSSDKAYILTMPYESITIEARFTQFTLTVVNKSQNNEGVTNAMVPSNAHSNAAGYNNKASYTISFNLNGASGTAPAAQTVTLTQGLTYPAVPVRSGHIFAGWYKTDACSGEPFDFTAEVRESSILYAKWINMAYQTFISTINMGGSISGIAHDSTPKYFAFVPLKSQIVIFRTTASTGRVRLTLFDETKSEKFTVGAAVITNTNVSVSYSVTAGTLYFIALQTQGNVYTDTTCTLNINGTYIPESGGKLHFSSALVTAGTTLTLNAATNDGHTFLGWFKDGGAVAVSTELNYTLEMPLANVVYTAKWIACPVTLAASEGGSVSGTEKTIMGAETTITAVTKSGYTFLGWFKNDAATPVTTNLSYSFIMTDETVTYTAKWQTLLITLIAMLDDEVSSAGGSVSAPAATVMGEEITITAYTYSGYTFIGWFKDDSGSSIAMTLEYTFILTGEAAVYTAKWTACPITVIRTLDGVPDTNGGSVSGIETSIMGEAATLTVKTSGGYTFMGWYEDGGWLSGETSYEVMIFSTQERTIEARWSRFYITLNRNITEAGTVSGGSSGITAGTEKTIVATTNAAGYTWLGWYDFNGELVSENESHTFTMPFTNVILEARWARYSLTVKQDLNAVSIAGYPHIVSFDLNGGYGVVPAAQTITAAQGLIYPNNIPERSGFAFAGWFTNPAGTGEAFDFSAAVTQSITLYAKWLAHSGRYAVNTNFGYHIVYSKTIEYLAFVPLVSETVLINAPNNFGSSSSGTLSLRNASKGVLASTNDPYHGFTYSVVAGTLYYIGIVTDVDGGGSFVPRANGTRFPAANGVSDVTVPGADMSGIHYITSGTEMIFSATNYDAYTWTGWYLDGVLVSEEQTYSFTMPKADAVLSARFIPKVFSISYELNGGINDWVNPKTYTVESETLVLLPAATNMPGYTFSGWYTTPDFEPDSLLTQIVSGSCGDLILYALFEADSYAIMYNLNGGTNAKSNPHSYKVTSGDITLDAPAKDGYTFIGWQLGSEIAIAPVISSGSMGEKEFTAQWEAIKYSLFLDAGEGTLDTDHILSFTIETGVSFLPIPELGGNPFTGWLYENCSEFYGNIPFVTSIPVGVFGDITLYALYGHIVTFKASDNSLIKTDIVLTGNDAVPPIAPIVVGYTFTNWSDSYTDITTDTTLTALYKINYYTVSFYNWDNTLLSTQTVPHGGSATPPSAPTRKNYTFSGWSGAYTNVTSDRAVYANFNYNEPTPPTPSSITGKTMINSTGTYTLVSFYIGTAGYYNISVSMGGSASFSILSPGSGRVYLGVGTYQLRISVTSTVVGNYANYSITWSP